MPGWVIFGLAIDCADLSDRSGVAGDLVVSMCRDLDGRVCGTVLTGAYYPERASGLLPVRRTPAADVVEVILGPTKVLVLQSIEMGGVRSIQSIRTIASTPAPAIVATCEREIEKAPAQAAKWPDFPKRMEYESHIEPGRFQPNPASLALAHPRPAHQQPSTVIEMLPDERLELQWMTVRDLGGRHVLREQSRRVPTMTELIVLSARPRKRSTEPPEKTKAVS